MHFPPRSGEGGREATGWGRPGKASQISFEVRSARRRLAAPTRLRLQLSHPPPQGEG